MKKWVGLGLCAVSLLAGVARADVFMDAAWAKQACDAWNKNEVLTTQLVKTSDGYEWVSNDAGRGYKLVQIYRTNCKDNSRIQLNLALQNGKAWCVYGGSPDGKAMNMDVDYVMHANDQDWACIGQGSFGCGAMGAMMTGKLKFAGPKMEAMSVMVPFDSFLRLTGAVAGDKSVCPSPPPVGADAAAGAAVTEPESVTEPAPTPEKPAAAVAGSEPEPAPTPEKPAAVPAGS